jgi:hypothetical protein
MTESRWRSLRWTVMSAWDAAMIAAEPADLPFHPAFLMGALDTGLAVEGVKAPV